MAEQFLRRNQKPGMFEPEPDWLNNYDVQMAKEKSIDIKAKLRGLKKYGYDEQTEDYHLNRIRKELGHKSGVCIEKRIKKIGVKNLRGVYDIDLILEAEKNVLK